jgi:hypothetical protein
MGKAEADFGKGFYMGEDYSFAKQRAEKAVEKSARNAVRRGIANTSNAVVLTFEMSEEDFEAFRAVGQTDYDTSKRPRQDCKEVIQYYR